MEKPNTDDSEDLIIKGTTEIVTAYLALNPMTPDDVKRFIEDVRSALSSNPFLPAAQPIAEKKKPAVSIEDSLKGDQLTCLECGQKFTSLKRHLRSEHDLSPDEYREKWDLPADYPMIPPSYSKKRSALAKEMGLGGKVGKNR